MLDTRCVLQYRCVYLEVVVRNASRQSRKLEMKAPQSVVPPVNDNATTDS